MNIQLLNTHEDQTVVEKKIKCVVWDLDNTLWEGVLLEDHEVVLRDSIIDIVQELDNRGILQSISSKNDYDTAMKKLKMFQMDHYFLYPQINWNAKSSSIQTIKEHLNIGMDSIAFVDDQDFELDEVVFALPEVLCIGAPEIHSMLDYPALHPKFITEDSKNRRLLYINDIRRNEAEENYKGVKEDFLASLKMKLHISTVTEKDLQRVEELTIRTHQLNTTGYTYSYEELLEFMQSDQHLLLISSLDDAYGSYGKIGLILIEKGEEAWEIKLLLMSCRVMSRGIGTIMLYFLSVLASKNKVRLEAEFVPNGRNRMMYITYKFAGFKEAESNGVITILRNDLLEIQQCPDYIQLTSDVNLQER